MKVSQTALAALASVQLAISLIFPAAAQTEEGRPIYWMENTVVVGDRMPVIARKSTWATSVMSRRQLDQLPVQNLASALNYVPGLQFVDRAGYGRSPMAIVRGFFGGGETEYILLTVDGVPTNDPRTGLAEWNQVPLGRIDRVEVLRGGGSAVYGDAALGAVVNVVTRQSLDEQATSGALSIGGGSSDERAAHGLFNYASGKHRFSGSVDARRSDGFRQGGDWRDLNFLGRVDRIEGASRRYLWLKASRLNEADPGPLRLDQPGFDRTGANPLFDMDRRTRNLVEVAGGLDGRVVVQSGLRATNQDRTRTLLLTPDFSDSQLQQARSMTVWTRIQRPAAVTAGLDSELGFFESRYFASPQPAIYLSEGDGRRLRLGLYAEATRDLSPNWRLAAGARYDLIRDQVTVEADRQTGTVAWDRTFRQFTPRAGLNYSYRSDDDHPGNLYLNWTRSFKAPTLDQLFDTRSVAGPQGPVSFASATLTPQKATGLEIGAYQRISVVESRLYCELAASAFRMNLDDEIDFDLATLKYGNIQRSRHDGVEISTTAYVVPLLSATTVLNLSETTFRSGANRGNRLKNIPRLMVASFVALDPREDLRLVLAHRGHSKSYLDDGNTTSLTGYQTVDAKLSWELGDYRCYLNVFNVMNSDHQETGFLLFDPTQGGEVAFGYPTQGRQWTFGIDISLIMADISRLHIPPVNLP